MKILNVFNQYLERGGEAQAVESICDSLSQICELRSCHFASADWIGPNAPPTWKQALLMVRNPASLRTIRDHMQQFRPDVWLVHNVFPVGSAAIYPEARELSIPIIQYIHNFRPFSVNGYLWAGDRLAPEGLKKNYWPEIRYGSWRNSRVKTAWFASILWLMHARNLWESVKAWVAISDFMREKFISAGIPAKHIFTLRHFWRPRAKPNHDIGASHFLYLGRLTAAKGIWVLIEAWEILEFKLGKRAPRLIIAGAGPLRDGIVARIERLTSVSFVGELSGEEKSQALKAARAVIVPSVWWEALGLVVYEAYEYYRPVLIARSGGLPEIVTDCETGLIHEPGHAEQLAAHVLQLHGNQQLSTDMGAHGRKWLEAHTNESQWQCRFTEIAEHAISAL